MSNLQFFITIIAFFVLGLSIGYFIGEDNTASLDDLVIKDQLKQIQLLQKECK